jgi:4-diphosphocytidyl-2-C-methyl-D-erythritol kinase
MARSSWDGAVRVESPAKVNLGLEITSKREDGFHELVSVMQTVGLADALIFEPADEISVESGVAGLKPEDDLMWRAAMALREATGSKQGVRIRAEKRIPSRAGLGGGSSNCAVVLRTLNDLWATGRSREELAEIAARLGSDPAFFLWGGTALTTGRGEIVEPLPDAPERWIVLAKPPESLSTPGVYAELRAAEHTDGAATRALAEGLRKGRLDYGLMRNNLAPAALRLCPAMEPVLATLRERADFAMVSGSGSTCFGLFGDEPAARRSATDLSRLPGVEAWPCRFIPAASPRLVPF